VVMKDEIKQLLEECSTKKGKKKYEKIRGLQRFLNWKVMNNPEKEYEPIITWLEEQFKSVADFIQYKFRRIEMHQKQKKIKDELLEPSEQVKVDGVYPLNKFEAKRMQEDSISALCVVFKKGSKLCTCSGVKFYSDSSGINVINSVQAGKSDHLNLSPILFN